MQRLSTIEEFKVFRQQLMLEEMERKPTLVVSAGTCGQASGVNDIIRVIKRQILEKNLQNRISLKITGCQGFCEMDPTIVLEPQGYLYPKVKMDDVPLIIDASLNGEAVKELLFQGTADDEAILTKDRIPFFQRQTRTVLALNEKVDPIRITDYVKNGGYAAFAKVFSKPDPEWIISEIKASGLRGRGGAGFPTGRKWEAGRTARSHRGQKYIVCNCDEGDPGAYMDRAVLEGNPHCVIEGMVIAGLAVGATKGYAYVRSEYPLAIKHSQIAIRQATELGILGENILGTGISFNIEIVRGAGAFVCGEETALIASIEGKVGEPRQRPPYPVEKGIRGCTTVINNVETLANVPVIIDRGAAEYAKVGVPGNTGTKIFSLVGKVRNTGLVEVPMGMSLHELIYDIGGGSSTGARIKAVQTGGPSGGCIPVSMFDLHIDYDSLSKAGSIMGSGGVIVMDSHTCMVDIAKYYMKFLKDESCGKCFTCRKGTQRMYEILEDISEGRGTMTQLDLLEELALVVRDTTMCGLGQTAPNPVLSTLRYFREEYVRHIFHKECDAHVCKDLVGAPCNDACPIGTEAWRYVAHISRGEFEEAYKVIREVNPFPSICARVCDHKCEANCRLGRSGDSPVSIRALKRFVTDTIDPSLYQPLFETPNGNGSHPIAIVGSGPAGLTAAHYLSLKGYKVTVLESEPKPGGMLFNCIPAYRLPRETLEKEIASLLNDNIKLEFGKTLGKDFTIDSLMGGGYHSVFVAIGAQKGRRPHIENEDAKGVLHSIEFLKAFNIQGKELAKGKVGVLGGGNSAVDAARTALRQKGVKEVTILYRRTREEMPAYEEEVEASLEEGIKLETLVTPTKILTNKSGKVSGIKCIRNQLGGYDESGRRRPVPQEGSEFELKLDTLIIAISEAPDIDTISPGGEPYLQITRNGAIHADADTLACSRPGVFAGGDAVTGPNTVVDAIAAGRKAAVMIDRYIHGKELKQPGEVILPSHYLEPSRLTEEQLMVTKRASQPAVEVSGREKNFVEVSLNLSPQHAIHEARRCLRCDLEFTEKSAFKTTAKKAEAI